MYSIVLMAALTTGGATPECHWSCGGCWGGWGCHGCYGGCWGGYSCYGGGCWGCFGCHGCYGGYSGWGCYGCYGGCYGCSGCYCSGYWGGYGGGYGGYGITGVPSMPTVPTVPGATPPAGTLPKPTEKTSTDAARARLVVELPQDAKLYVDDTPMKSTSNRRVFLTPPLQPGQAYYYMLRAEVVEDGQTVSVSRRVIVRPGQEATTVFSDLRSDPSAVVRAAE